MAGNILPDHNGGVTGDIFCRSARLIADAEAKVEEAKKGLKEVEKRVKDDGVDLKDLRYIMKEAKGDPTQYIERLNRRTQYLAWLRAPVAKALSRIEPYDPDMADMSEEEREQYWKDQGFQAGLRADNRDTCPHDPNSRGGQCWLEGWEEGQLKNLSGITAPAKGRGRSSKKKDTPPPPPTSEEEDEADEETVSDEENDRRWGEAGRGEDE